MICFVTSTISSNSGANYPVTLKVTANRRCIIRSIEIIELHHQIKLRPWQILDILSVIFPRYVHSHDTQYEVSLGKNPVENPSIGYHPCLVVKKVGSDIEKRYRLDHCVEAIWALTINPAHLRAMIYWWRCNRDQYESPIGEWKIWRNED